MKASREADRVYIAHMLECIGRIDEYVQNDESRFRDSRLIQDAVLRNLQTLAESGQRLTDEAKSSEPGIPWRAISGFRNILVHDYLGLDADTIWQVIAQELTPLRKALERMSEQNS